MAGPLAVTQYPELECHRLELRFAATRLASRQALAALERSLAEVGQLRPLVVVPAPEPAPPSRFVLVDGYRRFAALRRLGRDTVRVEVWECGVAAALAALLTQSGSRPFEPLEQALLLQALTLESGLSQRALAQALGREPSWVSRRLALLTALPEPVLQAVVRGTLSSWAAVRVLLPLARANAEHAEALLTALPEAGLSTRELLAWLEHYQGASARVRERLVAEPGLFAKTLRAEREEREAERFARGPEGQWSADCAGAERLLQGLRRRLAALVASGPLAPALSGAFQRLARAFHHLAADIERHAPHASTPDP
jgi:ParB/RepB/Spo0J family partition protein